MSSYRKGNYHRLKIRKWLEAQGYKVEYLEQRQRIFTKTGKMLNITRDLFGADLIAMRRDLPVLFVQSKANRNHIAQGLKDLIVHPYPQSVIVWVVHWPARAKEPIVVDLNEVSDEAESGSSQGIPGNPRERQEPSQRDTPHS